MVTQFRNCGIYLRRCFFLFLHAKRNQTGFTLVLLKLYYHQFYHVILTSYTCHLCLFFLKMSLVSKSLQVAVVPFHSRPCVHVQVYVCVSISVYRNLNSPMLENRDVLNITDTISLGTFCKSRYMYM